jgi:hypothetical protein
VKRLTAATFALALIAALPALAQSGKADKLPPVQPPPDMDAPGATPAPTAVKSNQPVVPLANSDAEAAAAAEAEAKASAERRKQLESGKFTVTPPPVKAGDSPGLPDDVQKAAEATELPVVTVRQNGNERVEEYRKKGVLYFVRVVPQEGPPRYYVDNTSAIPPDLSPISGPSGVIKPVYYKLFEWK